MGGWGGFLVITVSHPTFCCVGVGLRLRWGWAVTTVVNNSWSLTNVVKNTYIMIVLVNNGLDGKVSLKIQPLYIH